MLNVLLRTRIIWCIKEKDDYPVGFGKFSPSFSETLHQPKSFISWRPNKNLKVTLGFLFLTVCLIDGGHGGGVEAAAGSKASAGRAGRSERSGPRCVGGEDKERRGAGGGSEDQGSWCLILLPQYQVLVAQRCWRHGKFQNHVISHGAAIWDGLESGLVERAAKPFHSWDSRRQIVPAALP